MTQLTTTTMGKVSVSMHAVLGFRDWVQWDSLSCAFGAEEAFKMMIPIRVSLLATLLWLVALLS